MNYESLIIHQRTKEALDDFLKQPTHCLLLIGRPGFGKSFLAYQIAASLLQIPPEELEKSAYFNKVSKARDKSEISIEAARSINKWLQLKNTTTKQVGRVVVIEDAQLLSEEAQNALLKLLEEPPAGNHFILIVDSATSLLPTVASRCQKLDVQPLSLEEYKLRLGNQYDNSQLETAWRLSQGGAGLMLAILNDDDHPLRQSIDSAKRYLRAEPYERLTQFENLSRSKAELNLMIEALSRLLGALQHSNLSSSQHKRVMKARKLLDYIASGLQANASTKLSFVHLSLNLKV